MKRFLFLFSCIILGSLFISFQQNEKAHALVPPSKNTSAKKSSKKKVAEKPKDKNLNAIARYFEKADSVHREAWWVLANERRPIGKSPFGKIQRALLSSQNIKLANKSMFRCDRYVVKRDVLSPFGFPQKAEIFEKCSAKLEAKKIGEYYAKNATEITVTFFPENLEELLGLGATVINKAIHCSLKGNESEQLISLKCENWAQERSKEHLIRLDVYDYEMKGRNLIKLRGKVYENLSESRKIEADVPMQGKIYVTETELYPPEEIPEVKPAKTATAPVAARGNLVPTKVPARPSSVITPIPPPRGAVDPDVMVQQQQYQSPQGPVQQWNPNTDTHTVQPPVPLQSYQQQLLQQQQFQQQQQQMQLQNSQQQGLQNPQMGVSPEQGDVEEVAQPEMQQNEQQQFEGSGQEGYSQQQGLPQDGSVPQESLQPETGEQFGDAPPTQDMQMPENDGQPPPNLENPVPVNPIPAGGVYGR